MDNRALIFPGSGSQYVGMGKKYYEQFPVYQRIFEEANDILQYDLKKICLEGSVIKLNKSEPMLCGIFVTSVAMYRAFQEAVGIEPAYMAGHSLGEYTALVCSEAISFHEMLKLVQVRSQLAAKVAKEKNGVMSVIMNLEQEKTEAICNELNQEGKHVSIACYNSPTQVMISGNEEFVMEVEVRAKQLGANLVPLIGSAPYHNPLMNYVMEEFSAELGKYAFRDAKYPIISNTLVTPIIHPEDIIKELKRQMIQPVKWHQTIQYLENNGIQKMIEIGPKNVLTILTKEITENIKVYAYSNQLNEEEKNELFGNNTNKAVDKKSILTMCNIIILSTRNNNHDVQVVEQLNQAYVDLEDLLSRIADSILCQSNVVDAVIEQLKLILKLKKVSKKVQKQKFGEVVKLIPVMKDKINEELT